MFGGPFWFILVFGPPVIAGAVAWLVLTVTHARTGRTWLAASLLGWVAIFGLPGLVGRDWLLGHWGEQLLQATACAAIAAGLVAVAARLAGRRR